MARFIVEVPGMAHGASIGLGSVLKRITTMVGIDPCGGCQARAERLDRLVAVGGKGSREPVRGGRS